MTAATTELDRSTNPIELAKVLARDGDELLLYHQRFARSHWLGSWECHDSLEHTVPSQAIHI